ncbi:HPr family phosphocarrier protein [Georgenia sp. Z1491]|uniref:HPr family phosphocarrier protein n=1 Tax=Georgenia sp. Z1491 TaxID=3416707 RepID=UPI003CE91761
MSQRTAVVASAQGLHARPASDFVAAASRSPVPVTIAKDGATPVPAGSILSVMSLGVKQGDTVVLEAAGDGAEETLDELVTMLEKEDGK